jgi:hypothetical protein
MNPNLYPPSVVSVILGPQPSPALRREYLLGPLARMKRTLAHFSLDPALVAAIKKEI